ncbi:hypothetical protein [Eisenbergiella tayi]|uniref:hypothetical protein n=1 Tax=Eisenbergiella tayi TaxID=1432052 RepID=UPI00084874B6|nr:hypothetical protein [Eisenbergiella tayi]ODR36230.1 hypothetical protein BEI60_13345 [Eisenbergiella tayi]
MKEKCRGIKSSIWIMLAGLFLSCLFQFYNFGFINNKVQEYLVMLFGGSTASALVTLIIYSAEYQSCKISSLEEYWSSQFNLLQKFHSIKYFDFDVPMGLLQEYFSEKAHNIQADSLISQLPKYKGIPHDNTFRHESTALDKWCDFIDNDFIELKDKISPEEYKKLLIESVNRSAIEHLNNLEKIISDYCSISEISYAELEKEIGNIEFISGKKSWKKVYIDIHQPMKDELNKIKNISYHFKLYLNKESNNIPVVFHFLDEIQNTLFNIEIHDNETMTSKLVYNYFYDRMDRILEDFRSNIYNSTPEYKQRQCVYCTTHSKYNSINK